MRRLVVVVLIVGGALAAGGVIAAVLGFSGASAARGAYVANCLMSDASATCPTLRNEVDALDAVMLAGLVTAFIGADLLILGLLFLVSPTYGRVLPAPK